MPLFVFCFFCFLISPRRSPPLPATMSSNMGPVMVLSKLHYCRIKGGIKKQIYTHTSSTPHPPQLETSLDALAATNVLHEHSRVSITNAIHYYNVYLSYSDSKTQRQTGRAAQLGNISAAMAVR